MREKTVESKFTSAVKAKGGLAVKFTSPGFNGMPDRLVMFPGGRIAFVEVKTRAANALARPCEWVTASKQRKLIISAEIYLSRRKCSLQPSFDVFEIVTADKNRFDVIEAQLIENAFGI